eukprot:gene23119-1407_t
MAEIYQSFKFSESVVELMAHVSPMSNLDLVGDVTEYACGTIILSCSSDSTIRLWDVSTREEIKKFEGHTGAVNSAIFTEDESKILSASDDGTVRVWDIEDGKEIQKFDHGAAVTSVVFSKDESKILSATGREVKLKRIEDNTEIMKFENLRDVDEEKRYGQAVFNKDESLILHIATLTIRIVDLDTERGWYREFGGAYTNESHTDFVRSVIFSKDGSKVLSASDDKTIRMWDRVEGTQIMKFGGHAFTGYFGGHTDHVLCASFNRDESKVLSASDDGSVIIWNAEDDVPCKQIIKIEGHAGSVSSAAFSNDETRILSASHDKTIRLWDSEDGTEIIRLEGHTDNVNSAIFLRGIFRMYPEEEEEEL